MVLGNKSESTPYEVVRIGSWEEYLSMISDSPYQNWAFRGQRDASAPLFSALSRYFMSFRVDPRAWPEQVELTKPGNFRKRLLSEAANFVWLGEPYAMNRRLIAQSGTFLVPAILNKSIEEILKDYPNPKQTLIKFILPANRVREKGMRELYRMNVTQATLFPDLDGLARSLAYELEFHWAYDPRTMKPRQGESK